MKNALPASRQGFTIVELLVAFTIGMMLIIGGTVAANNFNAKQRVDAASSQIIEVVNSARNYAMTRQKPTNYVNSVEYVVVTLDVGGTAKVMAGNNSAGIDTTNAYTTKKIDIKDVTILPVISNGDLIFSVPEGKLLKYHDAGHRLAEPRTLVDNIIITVRSEVDNSYEKSVNISAAGVIKEE